METTTTRPTEHKQKKQDEAANAVMRVGCVSLKIKHQAKKGNAQRVLVYLWAKNEIRWDEAQAVQMNLFLLVNLKRLF